MDTFAVEHQKQRALISFIFYTIRSFARTRDQVKRKKSLDFYEDAAFLIVTTGHERQFFILKKINAKIFEHEGLLVNFKLAIKTHHFFTFFVELDFVLRMETLS